MSTNVVKVNTQEERMELLKYVDLIDDVKSVCYIPILNMVTVKMASE